MNMKRMLFVPVAALAVLFSACSKDDNKSGGGACFADSFELTETDRRPDNAGGQVFLDFDVKNTSANNYDIATGSRVVNLKMVVTTTDGSKYETIAPLTVTSLTGGATTTTLTLAKYGVGKEFSSVTITKSCR
ncbi:hypothetical protein [uncultured Chitinophaga sp.]|uniref:hypothetical protein n=1 Tax=uncultured Chitinophaga sp. TaxID=339340 RepID=UPI0025F964B3|nr:hypothetical protein [uncultured Chitinophaga sp.]